MFYNLESGRGGGSLIEMAGWLIRKLDLHTIELVRKERHYRPTNKLNNETNSSGQHVGFRVIRGKIDIRPELII